MVAALGGPADLVERPETHLTAAPVMRDVTAPRAGYIARIATREIGLAVVTLGGGRVQPGDEIDHRVGVDALAGMRHEGRCWYRTGARACARRGGNVFRLRAHPRRFHDRRYATRPRSTRRRTYRRLSGVRPRRRG